MWRRTCHRLPFRVCQLFMPKLEIGFGNWQHLHIGNITMTALSLLCRFYRASFLSMEREARIDLTTESTETTEMWRTRSGSLGRLAPHHEPFCPFCVSFAVFALKRRNRARSCGLPTATGSFGVWEEALKFQNSQLRKQLLPVSNGGTPFEEHRRETVGMVVGVGHYVAVH